MNELREALMDVYAGRRDVYGRQKVATVWNDEVSRAERRATWTTGIEGPVGDALIDAHLAGTHTIGVYVLHADSSCRFVLWDIDGNDRAAAQLILRELEALEIAALLTDSGGKGYHVVVAFADALAGQDAFRFGRAIWERAGSPANVECFPKQGAITPELPYGNLVKLPLGVHKATGRRCAILTRHFEPVIEGSEVDELDGLRRAAVARVKEIAATAQTPTFSGNGSASSNNVTSSGFVHVPYPCFADLSTTRYRQGERDTLLFTLTKHLRQQGQPRAFAEMVIGTQAGRCAPPYDERDPGAIVASVYEHGYSSFGCETREMEQFCRGVLCPLYQRTHDVSTPVVDADAEPGTEGRIVVLEDLIQLGSESPEYEVTVCGRRITGLDADTIYSWRRFAKAVMAGLRFIPELPRVKGMHPDEVWRELVNDALDASTLEERPGDASTDAEIVEAAIDFLSEGITLSEERADVLEGSAWDDTTETGELYRYFLGKYVGQAVRMRVGAISHRHLYGALRRRGVEGVSVKINRRAHWVWRIPIQALNGSDGQTAPV